MYCVDRLSSQPSFANSGASYGPIMITLNALLCVDTSFSIAARRSPSVYVANLTLIPGYIFSKLDVVSGIICPVISGLDTTATVIVPELLLLLPPLALVLLLLEQAASATRAATEPTAASVRSLNGGELMNRPPQRCGCSGGERRGDGGGIRSGSAAGPGGGGEVPPGGRPATFRSS